MPAGTSRESVSHGRGPLHRLVELLAQLPGLGRRSAQRLAFHLLKQPAEQVEALAQALLDLKRQTRQCSICHNLTEEDPCPICSDPQRDQGVILVVEQPDDVAAFEASGLYRGTYHVLMGRLAPLESIGPEDLTIAGLLERVRSGRIREVIIGTQPTLEGDGTALYLSRELAPLGVRVTRLARGLPVGYELERVAKAVLAEALEDRRELVSPRSGG